MALQLRTRHRLLHNPSLVHFYSSNTPDPTTPPPPQPDSTTSDSPASQSPFTSSYISDVKARLKQQEQNQQLRQQFTRRPTYASSFADRPQNPPPKFSSLEEIRKNLSEFRRRSAGPIPGEQSHSSAPPVRFQELYKRNVLPRGGDEPYGYGPGPARPMGDLSLGAVRESLKHLQPNARDRTEKRGDGEPLAFSTFKESLKLKPTADNSGYGRKVSAGTEALPFSVFGKEIKEREAAKGKEGEGPTDEALSSAMQTEFVKMYSYKELGERLRTLRPETDKKGGGGFSLEELNERLRRLRELEESENQSKLGGIIFKELRESLTKVKISDEENSKKRSLERLDIIGQMTQTPEFMMNPPKEHLVEKYFHPDNMSSAEKLKIELAKVRDEFKLSESDCGSARVQVAQLTTKIKHLASVLHKKDKHSRKGLEEMVQKRKKLLKYLRRTDWESYCLVLSKLGLRDNADIKH